MKKKNKVTGVIREDEKLEEKVTAELKKKDPEDAEEIIAENRLSREKQGAD